jgi:hypothetical protein
VRTQRSYRAGKDAQAARPGEQRGGRVEADNVREVIRFLSQSGAVGDERKTRAAKMAHRFRATPLAHHAQELDSTTQSRGVEVMTHCFEEVLLSPCVSCSIGHKASRDEHPRRREREDFMYAKCGGS